MKILVISDTHGNKSIIDEVIKKEKDIDIYLHLGDFELPEYLMTPFLCVKGNCDYFSDLPLSRTITQNGFKIYMEHGVNFTRSINKEEYIKNTNADIFLFGHTHSRYAYKLDNIYVFNPGSLAKPRDGNKGTYLILTLEENNLKYEFKEIEL